MATDDSGSERRDPDQVANDPDAVGPDVRGGYHFESWHDVTIEVPDTWVYGALNQWCANDGLPDEPILERPGGVQTLMLCTPASGYGVRFQDIDNTDDFQWPLVKQSGDTWPADAYVGARGLGGVLVEVALPDLALAQEILDSAQHNESLDPNGCPVDVQLGPRRPRRHDDGLPLRRRPACSSRASCSAAPTSSPPSLPCGRRRPRPPPTVTRSQPRPSAWPRWPRTRGSISAAARSWCTVRRAR